MCGAVTKLAIWVRVCANPGQYLAVCIRKLVFRLYIEKTGDIPNRCFGYKYCWSINFIYIAFDLYDSLFLNWKII